MAEMTMEEFEATDPLLSAMKAYKKMFGHAVPSAELKTAALMGSREKLAEMVRSHLEEGKPNPQWAKAKSPFSHEIAQGLPD